MQYNSQRKAAVLGKTEKGSENGQMAGLADRQKFRESLHHGKDHDIDPHIHGSILFLVAFGFFQPGIDIGFHPSPHRFDFCNALVARFGKEPEIQTHSRSRDEQ